MPYKDKAKQLESQRAHYRRNPKARQALNKKRKNEISQMVRDLKHMKPCVDCGVSYPYYIMDYDHLPGEDKKLEVSNIYRRMWGDERIMEEISKCELVCANCHRERTFSRMGS